MLQPNELKIGNLVYFNNNHKEIGIVTGIVTYISGHTNINLNHRRDISYSYNELNPIELTEEWITKFGFQFVEKAVYNTYNGYVKDNIYVINEVYQFSRRVLKPAIHENFWEDTCLRCLKYVHELQNLYNSLTGEELTIKE